CIVNVEEEPGPGDVDAVTRRARRIRIGRDPFLVVERRAGSGRVDEGWRSPAQIAASAERSLANDHHVQKACSVESEARVERVAVTVERDGGVTACVIWAAGQVLDAGN